MFKTISSRFSPVTVDNALTIGIAAHGNVATTTLALHSLFASVHGNFQLILVDDSSNDDTLSVFEDVAEYHANTQIFRFDINMEYSGSLHVILSHARGDNILFLSNDIFVTPSYIRELLRVAAALPAAGIVRGCSNFVDNGLPLHTVRDCGELNNFNDLFAYAEQREAAYTGRTIEDAFLTGDAFLVNRRVLELIGYIDQRFYGYFADHDFALRARQASFTPQLALAAFAWHQHGANMDYLPEPLRQEKLRTRWARVNENWARFKDKYGLPSSMPYTGMRQISWDALASQKSTPAFIPSNDFSTFRLPAVGSETWRKHKAIQAASRARKQMEAARLADAEQTCKKALKKLSNCSELLNELGVAQVYQGRVSTGITTLRRAVAADKTNVKAHSNLLLSMHYAQSGSARAIYRESVEWATQHTAAPLALPLRPPKRSRIRIGYLSPDFRRHSVSYFFLPLLANHDREQFELFCFSDVESPDDVTAQMVALADGWRDISGLTNDKAEEIIREVALDILVDLAGHTGRIIRLPLFAHRLAPIQVSWLGYPDTTGLPQMDYRMTDEAADPTGTSDRYYSEKLIRLPNGFLCYRPQTDAPDLTQLPALKNGIITFGCFNMLPKIQNVMIDAWCTIMQRVPGSRLILKNHFFRDALTADRIRRRFKDRGIPDDRLELWPSDPDTRSHLAHYGKIDIALDTFPYAGTTTTCEALWQGVPVVSLCGNRHASRVGFSIMRQLGREEFVADNIAHYCDIACMLAEDLDVLQSIRQLLRYEMYDSPLCDEEAFAKSVEAFYRTAVNHADT